MVRSRGDRQRHTQTISVVGVGSYTALDEDAIGTLKRHRHWTIAAAIAAILGLVAMPLGLFVDSQTLSVGGFLALLTGLAVIRWRSDILRLEANELVERLDGTGGDREQSPPPNAGTG